MSSERDLVLGCPDLAAQLLRTPLGFKHPEQWNGFIPPYMVFGQNKWIRNDSPQRVHLVAIVREAMARKYGEDVARNWLEQINSDRWSGDNWTPHTAVERG